jgi:hypothetical protein
MGGGSDIAEQLRKEKTQGVQKIGYEKDETEHHHIP